MADFCPGLPDQNFKILLLKSQNSAFSAQGKEKREGKGKRREKREGEGKRREKRKGEGKGRGKEGGGREGKRGRGKEEEK